MALLDLLATTGDPEVDTIAQSVITLFEAAFPDRIVSYFVEGSFASGSAVATSDLDLIVVFRLRFVNAAERAAAERVGAACAALSRRELDLLITDEAGIAHGTDPMFKLGTRCLYGDDIREAIPLLPIELWARERMHVAYWLINHTFGRPHNIRLPVDYPDPTAAFYGYDQPISTGEDHAAQRSTRALVRVLSWAATALIAYGGCEYVLSKQECALKYQRVIGDEWSDLIAEVLKACREQWNYRVPSEQHAQQRLHAMCQQALGFENHFLKRYRQFLLAELASQDEAALREALRVLSETFLDDAAVIQAVEQLRERSQSDLRDAAELTLTNFQERAQSMI